MPLPNTKVIHPDWSAHHYAVADGQMTAEGTITRPGTPVFDELLGRNVLPAPGLIYDGPMRVQRVQPSAAAAARMVADREVVIREYQVGLPLSVNGVATKPVQVNDVVTVIGLVLRVRDIRDGSLLWQRDLSCEDIAPTTR